MHGNTTTRELAQRQSGSVEIALLWHPASDRVELSIHDLATGTDLRLDVAPAMALDAFRHPFAYVRVDASAPGSYACC
jgi:ABC-type phosphate transport system ATPase subunit